MIYLEKAEWENFLTFYGKHSFSFHKNGMHFIQGINKDSEKLEGYNGTLMENQFSIGSGKTSFTQIAMYALYGEITKKLNKDDVINKLAERNCCVKLWFNKDDTDFYRVERYRRHSEYSNNVFLFKKVNDKWDEISYEETEETQELLNKITKLNEITFRKCTLFHRDDAQYFMDLNIAKRSALFENITTQFESLHKYFHAVKKFKKQLGKKIENFDLKLIKEKTITIQNIKTIDDAKKFLEEKKIDLNGQIDAINNKISYLLSIVNADDFETLKIKINKRREYKSILLKMENDGNVLDNDLDSIEDKISTLDKSILFINKVIQSKSDELKNIELIKCDNCGHILKFSKEYKEKIEKELCEQKDHHISLIEKNNKQYEIKQSINKKIEENKKEIRLINEKISNIKLSEDIEKIIDETDIITKIDNLKHDITLLENSRKTYKKNFKSTVKKVKSEIGKNKDIINNLKKDLDKLKTLELLADFWNEKLNIREENSIKQFLMLTVIPVFNLLLQKILDYVYHGDLTIAFDSYFNETLVKNGKIYKYNELSTGERLKLNLCISLAIFDLTRINMSGCSVLFIDEVLTNIDEPTIKTFLKLFTEKYSNKSAVYVISHQENVKNNIRPQTVTYITKEFDKSNIKIIDNNEEIENEFD